MAVKIKLRQKAISGNRQSLYLDFYPGIIHPETGNTTRREFLGLYVLDKPKTPIDKQHNKEVLQLAENIRAKRQIDIQTGDFGFLVSNKKPETDFIELYRQMAESKTGSNRANWIASLNCFKRFAGDSLKALRLNEHFCNEYRKFLLPLDSIPYANNKQLSKGTACIYFGKFKCVLKQAHKDGLIKKDLTGLIDSISTPTTQREFLTYEELQQLAKTPCKKPILKNAAIFSALTGLRVSDILKLVWSEVQYSEAAGGYFIQYRQKKTKSFEVLNVSDQAVSLLGERKGPNEQVFKGFKYSTELNEQLRKWATKAGINKHITFHCFRHTYATLQLSFGTDIYTVSKMLGHRDLSTTQVYAKIIDHTKREAANKIKLDF
jgi:integrase